MPLNTNNSGKIGGSGTLDANVDNTGTIYAQNGTYEVTGSITGAGVLELDGSGDLRVDGGVTGQHVSFANATGLLTVEQIGSFAPAEIDGFAAGNTIDIAGQPNVGKSFDAATNTLSLTLGASTLPAATLKFGGGPYSANSFVLGSDGNNGTQLTFLPCFAAGTRICTERGDTPVGRLRVGDRVLTGDGSFARVTWLGHRQVNCRKHPRPQDVWPVRVRASAFGEGRPRRDLLLSPDHAVFADDVLVPVRYLTNRRTVVQEAVDKITYWHVELDRHDVLLAEGLPCESYLDTGNRSAFAGGGAVVQMHPDFAFQVWKARGCAPLVLEGPVLAGIRRRLLAQAMLLGHALTEDPALKVLADGREVAVGRDGARWLARLPPATRRVRLVSRVWSPAHTRADERDTRLLGVAVGRLWLNGREVALDSEGFGPGWHPPEPDWRWTDGNAELAASGVEEVAIDLAMTGTYWSDSPPGEAEAA